MNEKQQVIFNLDLLRRYLKNFDPGFFCNAINHKAFVEDLKKAGEMLQADQWIPVSERMPDEDEDVHVYRGERHAIITAYRSEGRWYSHQHDILRDVTHWMPLPAPPEVDQP